MIKNKDLIKLSIKKFRIRLVRVLFTILISSLGIIIVSTGLGLYSGIKEQFNIFDWNTLPENTIEIKYSTDKVLPVFFDEYKFPKFKMKKKEITDTDIEMIKKIDEIVVIGRKLICQGGVYVQGFLASNKSVNTEIHGFPGKFIKYYSETKYKNGLEENLVPIIVSEKYSKNNYYDSTLKRISSSKNPEKLIGKKVNIIVGDMYSPKIRKFKRNYNKGFNVFECISDTELKSKTKKVIENISNKFDLNIVNQTLKFRGIVVGTVKENRYSIYMPSKILKKFMLWYNKRNKIAIKSYSELSKKNQYNNSKNKHNYDEFMDYCMYEHPNYFAIVKNGKGEKVFNILRNKKFFSECNEIVIKRSLKELNKNLQTVRYVLIGLSVIIMGISFLFVLSTISRVVSDSKKEIGVFRAVGATKKDILKIFLYEGGILGSFSGIVGIVIGQLLAFSGSELLVNHFSKHANDFPDALYKFDFFNIFILTIVCLIFGMLSAVRPAYKAAKIDPVEVLKTD